MSMHRCEYCGGNLDTTFTCIRCGEVSVSEYADDIRKMRLTRKDEQKKAARD